MAATLLEKTTARTCSEYHAPITYSGAFPPSSSEQKSWNYNDPGQYGGVVHYGMLADFLQAVRTMPQHGELGTGAALIDNHLMLGAQYFYETWRLAEQQGAKVK